jgi:hypothetical protein
MSDDPGRGIPTDLLLRMESIAAEMRAERDGGAALEPDQHAALEAGYVDGLRSRGWLRQTSAASLESLLDAVVVRDRDGSATLDVESNVTDQSYLVPGWGVTEVDPTAVGRGLAEDDAELLGDMRATGVPTGWE